jgi:hypothetical protein
MDDVTKDLEALSADPIVKALIPVAGMLLNIACPAVPAVVWTALITAVVSGDLTPDHIKSFMEANGIKTYAEYPAGETSFLPLAQGTPNENINQRSDQP